MSSSKPKSSSKKITATDNNSLALGVINHIAKMLLEGFNIDEITTYLCDNVDEYRKVFTKGEPDDECNKAREQANFFLRNPQMSPIINYKNFKERNLNARMLNPTANIILGTGEDFRRFPNKIKILKNYKDKIRDEEYYTPVGKGYCGDCWLCGLPVYYYFNHEFVSSCGECEHIGGIVASILSGMLTSSIQQSAWSNYGSSHVHCNQNKGQNLTMKFNTSKNRWEVDEDGINTIINKINVTTIHAKEYDPEFKRNHLDNIGKNLSQKRREMTLRIRNYTNHWCAEANQILNNQRETNYAKRISNIILISYNSVIDKLGKAIIIEEQPIRNKKKRGGLIMGDTSQIVNNNLDEPYNNVEHNMLTKINEKIQHEQQDKREKMVEEEQEKQINDEHLTLPLINGFDVDILSEEEAQKEINMLLAIPNARQLFKNLIIAIDSYFNEIYKEDIDTLDKINILDNKLIQFIDSSKQNKIKTSHGGKTKILTKKNLHKKQKKTRNKTQKKINKEEINKFYNFVFRRRYDNYHTFSNLKFHY